MEWITLNVGGTSVSGGGSDAIPIPLTAALALALLVAIGYLASIGMKRRRRPPYPPGPPGHPLVGNLLAFPDASKGETFDTMNLEACKEHGLTFSVNIPLLIGRMVVTADPELAKRILVRKNYPKSVFYDMLAPMVGRRSLVTMPNGAEWAGLRRAFHRGFQPDFLREVVGVMAGKLERLVEAIDGDIASDEGTNMLERSQAFTADVIVSVAFGEDWGVEKHPARVHEDEIARIYTILSLNPLRQIFDWKMKKRMNREGVLLDEEMMKILDRRLASANDAATDTSSKDICSLAIQHMKQLSGGSLTEDDKEMIVDQLKTFYFAGHDTTATTIAWVMWELSKHPGVLDRVRRELKENDIWTDPKLPPSYKQLQRCDYLDAVIKEALRLYPPASGLTRQSTDPDETYGGYSIGGAILLVNAYCMHRHPKLWKDPDAFRPERMTDGSEGDVNAKLMYFSRGPRDCIGKHFAMLEAKLAVSALAARYDLACVDPDDRIHYNLTNVPRGGAKVKFSPRW